ncbi:MAG TPA: HAMP domain-containing sensor histidine kinase [Planctomycetota bacterium]
MVRRKLSFQLALAFLLAALLPLAGVAWLTLHLLESSLSGQARAAQEQVGRAAAALVRDFLNDATTKLKNIAQRIDPKKDPQAETAKLNAQVNPQGLFLEISYVKIKQTPEVVAQAQQEDYGRAQSLNRNRAFNDNVRQNAQVLSNDNPLVVEAQRNSFFWSTNADNDGLFNGLPISVPAAGKDVLVGTLDLKPIEQMLGTLGGNGRSVQLVGSGFFPVCSHDPRLIHSVPVGHSDWTIEVTEPPPSAIRQSRVQALVGITLAAVLALGLAALLGTRLTRPIRALAGTADALGRGDFAARSGIRRDDEIGQLAAAFDRMAGAVQELDRLKDDFVSHVSHELRTPLTSAKMTLANVQEGLSGVDTLGRVQGDLDRLIRMVNELLDVAKIESGVALEKRPTDLGALARATVDTLRPLAKVAVEVRGQGATVDADPARLQQVLLNLVDNALKYAKSRVDVELAGRSIRVTDDGPGVPPEHREAIFQRFAKVETGPKPPGAGLGLSIARKLAELHGGTLVCLGNTFELKL